MPDTQMTETCRETDLADLIHGIRVDGMTEAGPPAMTEIGTGLLAKAIKSHIAMTVTDLIVGTTTAPIAMIEIRQKMTALDQQVETIQSLTTAIGTPQVTEIIHEVEAVKTTQMTGPMTGPAQGTDSQTDQGGQKAGHLMRWNQG